MAGFARLLVHIFFRDIEVESGEHLPASGPVVVVANHINGLVDGLLLMATLKRYPRFLGKSTLFKILPLWPFLKFAAVVPVYRSIDDARVAQNVSAFATCHRILARGGVVAVFPEGISHDEASLQPLKTGAARIALEAGAEGAPDVVTDAVGQTYDAKARFRSRALVRIGTPVGISRWTEAYRTDSHEAVRQLTRDVADRLSAVSPSYASWEQATQLSQVAEIVVRQPQGLLSPVPLAAQVGVADRLAQVAQARPGDQGLADLVATFARYQRDLNVLGLNDSQLAAEYREGHVRASFIWALLRILAAIPFALVGVVVHIVPFQLMKQVAKMPTNEGIKATVKLLGCFASFTLVYAALGIFVGRAYGAWFGLLTAIGTPLCGYMTVRLAERAQRVGGLLERYKIVKERGADLHSLLLHRSEVVDAARSVLAAT